MRRRFGFRAIGPVLGAVAALLVSLAPGAVATPDAVVVSSDGSSWSSDLTTPLFEPTVRWVPGDARTSSFYVENRGRTAAEVRVQVRTGADDGLVRTGDVVLCVRVEGGLWRPAEREAGSALNTVALRVGEVQRIDVRAAFRAAAQNLSQDAGVALRFVVQLAEAASATAPGYGAMPDTGAPAVRLPLFLAALCCGTGLALVRRRPEHCRG